MSTVACRIRQLASFGALTLASCSSSVNSVDLRTANMAALDNRMLCTVYGVRGFRSDEAAREIEKRNIFSADDWRLVIERQLYRGMSACGLFAAFGVTQKQYVFKDNDSGQILQEQVIYDCRAAKVPDCPFTSIVLVDDKVVSWTAASGIGL
jgi:hypothetical protein